MKIKIVTIGYWIGVLSAFTFLLALVFTTYSKIPQIAQQPIISQYAHYATFMAWALMIPALLVIGLLTYGVYRASVVSAIILALLICLPILLYPAFGWQAGIPRQILGLGSIIGIVALVYRKKSL